MGIYTLNKDNLLLGGRHQRSVEILASRRLGLGDRNLAAKLFNLTEVPPYGADIVTSNQSGCSIS